MADQLDTLAARLGVPRERLAGLSAYDAADLARLDTAVADAMEAEDAAFDTALEEALRFVPRLLRGTAAKLLFPGGQRG